MSNYLENLGPTYQKTLRKIIKQIRESDEIDSNAVKALADLTRAYLQLAGKESDPDLDGDPNYYDKMLKDSQWTRQEQRKKPVKRKTSLIKRK